MAVTGIERHEFGVTPAGEAVERFVLTNEAGLKVALLSLGCIIQSVDTPDRGGAFANIAYGWDAIDNKGSGEDENGHGTHVAGIVAGRGSNGVGVAGTCWSASVVAVRFMNSRGQGSTSDAIDGLEYAARKGAKIINCSFGSSSSSFFS